MTTSIVECLRRRPKKKGLRGREIVKVIVGLLLLLHIVVVAFLSYPICLLSPKSFMQISLSPPLSLSLSLSLSFSLPLFQGETRGPVS